MIIFSRSDINGLYSQFKSIKSTAEGLLNDLNNPKTSDVNDIYHKFIHGVRISYYNAVNDMNNLKDSLNISVYIINNLDIDVVPYEIYGKLQLMIIECEKVIGILKNKINVPLTEIQQNKLNSIREQVNNLKLDHYYERNINTAIEHFEKGDFLACSLISSRIIVYCIDHISQKDSEIPNAEKTTDQKDEDRIKFLKEQKIISKRDQQTRIFKYVRNARNLLVHDIKVIPDASTSMSYLGDCVDILTILNKIQNKSH